MKSLTPRQFARTIKSIPERDNLPPPRIQVYQDFVSVAWFRSSDGSSVDVQVYEGARLVILTHRGVSWARSIATEPTRLVNRAIDWLLGDESALADLGIPPGDRRGRAPASRRARSVRSDRPRRPPASSRASQGPGPRLTPVPL